MGQNPGKHISGTHRTLLDVSIFPKHAFVEHIAGCKASGPHTGDRLPAVVSAKGRSGGAAVVALLTAGDAVLRTGGRLSHTGSESATWENAVWSSKLSG